MPNEPCEIDHRGDIRLRVGIEKGNDPNIFVVCSRALSRASLVFDRMLYGNFVESKSSKTTTPEEDWVVDLPEDKFKPMEIFLNISHAKFQQVPMILGVDDLYDLTVLTNYYDATRSLCPWLDTWMLSIDDIANDANMLMPKMLWVSWELGRKDIFLTTARRILMESEGSSTTETCELLDIKTPPDIIERIDAIRIQTFHALLEIFRDMIENLVVVDERPRWCHHATWMGPHRCESMILGSMTFCLARAGLWPLPGARELQYSILGLYGKLTGLVIHDIGAGPVSEVPSMDHRECNPRSYLLEEVRRVMDEIPNPLADAHVKHLDAQAKKLRS